jgi:DEAD/DEAH box helicase domain-containing protein
MDDSIGRDFGTRPQELFESPVDDLIVDLESKVILEAHLQCAGQEMPICLDDEAYFGPLTREICETKLQKDDEGW